MRRGFSALVARCPIAEHFMASNFKARDLAIEAYDPADASRFAPNSTISPAP